MRVEKRPSEEDGGDTEYYDIIMRGTKIRILIVKNGKVEGEGGMDEYDIARLKKTGMPE